jgi:hypothetical protein
VFVDGGEGELRRGHGRGEPVEPVLEDRVDVAIGAGLDGVGPGAGRFEPLRASAWPVARCRGTSDTCSGCGRSAKVASTRIDICIEVPNAAVIWIEVKQT